MIHALKLAHESLNTLNEMRDKFHAHLDECERCRNQPFNLCPTGAAIMSEGLKKKS